MNRRKFVTALAFTPVITLPSTAHAATDPHPTWLAEWRSARDQWFGSLHDGEETAQSLALVDHRNDLSKLICNTPAVTLEGAAAKLQWVLEDSYGDFTEDSHKEAIESACNTIGGVA